ncbi:hypothetical protein CRE_24574 [Caenorhabditis remanei]|uniref:C-type LECtin n=1 Tax=Caenorhabditis remanei TaxID=31234 RepID=E3MV86_CAERE|nr:hypothetical protein CRE_24574 [Caenorhabditis remanei]
MQLAVIPFFLHSFFYTSFAASTPVCTNGFTLINNKCLKLYTTLASYSVAEESCRNVGATLMTAKNANENQAFTTIVGSTVSLVWMGLYCMDSDPSKCLWDDTTGAAGMYSNFASGFPLVDIGKCVYYSVQEALAGKWISGDCDNDPKAYVCELPYTFAGGYISFHFCEIFKEMFQITVLTIKTDFVIPFIARGLHLYVATIATRGTSSDWVYIGAMYPSSNAFAWIDGSVWSYNNIDPFHTPRSGYSATIGNSKRSNNGFWTSVPFNWAHSFICKRPAETQCPPNQPTVTITSVPNQPSYCNSSLILAPGVITSPNYPQNYDINLFCSYQLATLGSYKILLQFTGFITESNDDIVNVYDEKKTSFGIIQWQLRVIQFSFDWKYGVCHIQD